MDGCVSPMKTGEGEKTGQCGERERQRQTVPGPAISCSSSARNPLPTLVINLPFLLVCGQGECLLCE